MAKPLNTTILCRCERVRGNNGITETLFTNRIGNGGASHEEHALFNLMSDRGVPEHGKMYEIIIKPVNE